MADHSPTTLYFYGTLDCHLCEIAEERLKSAKISFQYIDISEDDALIERYGWFIPVLKLGDEEFKSPLDFESLIPYLQKQHP